MPEEVDGDIPESEVRTKALVSVVQAGGPSKLEQVLKRVLVEKGSLTAAVTLLARVLAAMGSGHQGNSPGAEQALRALPSPKERHAAFKLLLF